MLHNIVVHRKLHYILQMEDYVFSDQHRGMRMDIEDMSYEVCVHLGVLAYLG